MNIGDPIATPHGKGKVGVVKVKGKSVYVRLPDEPEAPAESES